MPYIFKAKTQEGYIIKVLGELLQHIIKTGCFVIDHNGITLRMMDSHRKKLIDIKLDASKFSLYKFKTRINSQRIWKFYFLSIYLEDIL